MDPTVYHVDARAGVLTFRGCERSPDGNVTLNEGVHKVYGNQLASVEQALARIHARDGLCAFDGSDHLLDVMTVDGMQRMGDAVGAGACTDPPEGRYAGRTLVEGIPQLADLLASLPGG